MTGSEDFKRALAAGDLAGLRAVRKTDLHAHAYLSAGLDFCRGLSPAMPLPPRRFAGFNEFSGWLKANCLPVSRANYEAVLSAAFKRLAQDGVVYAEVSFDHHDADSMGLGMEEWGRLILALHAPYRGSFTLCPEFGISREEDPSLSLRRLEEAARIGVFRSVDLYGDETCRPVRDFERIYHAAATAKLKRKAHLGEFGTASDVREGAELLGLDMVQHGIAAAGDAEVMAFLRGEGITLNVCPSSNVALGRCRSLAEHPVRTLVDNGVRVTLNSDDYLVFGAGVTDELLALYKAGLFGADELWRILLTGLSEGPCRS